MDIFNIVTINTLKDISDIIWLGHANHPAHPAMLQCLVSALLYPPRHGGLQCGFDIIIDHG